MSEREYTITSKTGGFEVSSDGGPTHRGTIRNDGGADIVTFSDADPQPPVLRGGRPSDLLQDAGGTVEVDALGRTKVMGTTTSTIPPKPAGMGNILNSITDLAGRPAMNLEEVKKNPAGYKAAIGGTEASVESLLRAGIISIAGDGNFREDVKRQMQLQNPNDPSNSYNDVEKKEPNFAPRNDAVVLLSSALEAAGANPSQIFAKALGSDKASAAKDMSDALQMDDPQEAAELIKATILTGIETSAMILEKQFGLPQGEGGPAIASITSGPSTVVAQRLLHGMLVGDKAAYQEVVHRYRSGDRW
jgi:hypothetical protein